jgi:hypothetical protein
MSGKLCRTTGRLVMLALIGLPVTYARASRPTQEAAGIPPKAQARLLLYAETKAALNGDNHPYDIEAIRTTRRQADHLQRVSNPQAGLTEAVYLVAMRGRFKCDECSLPAGSTAPHGSVITFQLPVNEAREIVWTQGHHYPDLSRAGIVVHLRRSKPR